ncbi:O-antigen ligase family protein [Eggerthella guodeyinii]|uniref:O-antigen ligase family protein n=1 Tax=Eggerthella guodeyinii TaxID=2690837 RepID=A0A6L7J022_9ACTN|nr:O-antigen ligase family protein [Eggerthella guodeyinii]QOS68990.1 O-antigen ligase family protein [Eggerthella guodeyinii]
MRDPSSGVVKLLYLQLYMTLFLDGINEIATHFGFPIPLGQVIRAVFLVVDMLVVFSLGRRRDVQIMILCIAFFALESLREVCFGFSGVVASGVYWSKVLSCILIFLAIKASYQRGLLNKKQMDGFFKLSIIIIPLFFLMLTYAGVMSLNQNDAGAYGSILSKNALTSVLLILFTMSLKFGFESPIRLIWTLIVMLCLVLLGSKAALILVAPILVLSMLHQMGKKGERRLWSFLLLGIGVIVGLSIFGDRINEVIESQLFRLHYVTAVQGQSWINYLFSGRNSLLEAGFTTFVSGATPLSLLVGDGFYSVTHGVANIVQSSGDVRGIEMDLFEILFSSGLVGLFFILLPVVEGVGAQRTNKSRDRFLLILALIVVLAFSILGGHVYTEGMASEYLGIFLGYLTMKDSKNSQDDQIPGQTSQSSISETSS